MQAFQTEGKLQFNGYTVTLALVYSSIYCIDFFYFSGYYYFQLASVYH